MCSLMIFQGFSATSQPGGGVLTAAGHLAMVPDPKVVRHKQLLIWAVVPSFLPAIRFMN